MAEITLVNVLGRFVKLRDGEGDRASQACTDVDSKQLNDGESNGDGDQGKFNNGDELTEAGEQARVKHRWPGFYLQGTSPNLPAIFPVHHR